MSVLTKRPGCFQLTSMQKRMLEMAGQDAPKIEEQASSSSSSESDSDEDDDDRERRRAKRRDEEKDEVNEVLFTQGHVWQAVSVKSVPLRSIWEFFSHF